MASLESLPQDLFNQIAVNMEFADLTTLALASRRLHKLASCDELWIDKITADFGSRDVVIELLAQAGVDISEHLDANTDLVPWYLPDTDPDHSSDEDGDSEMANATEPYSYTGIGLRCYRDRYAKVYPASDDELTSNVKRAESSIDEVKQMLRAGPEAGIQVFTEAAYRLMLVQEYFPDSAECYYLWALICFMLNDFKPSLGLLEIGHAINSSFEPIIELTKEVRSLVEGAYGSQGDAPLLDAAGSGPSPHLAKVLAILFQRLDSDRDGVLNASELANMIRLTNGQAPPAAMISQIIAAFGGPLKAKNGRKVTGWDIDSLTNFYVAQTLDDPQETRGDLAKFGFNPRTLKPE
ncbi:hypothetical protein GGI07_000334 [Coemansia sp. Benny D115]|nr:hypothetical protein GGI07_000334 [Coemansia sp. Benny D115]